MLIDTHCHLGDERFADDRDAVVARARAAGVGHVVVVADSWPSSREALALAERYGWSATAGVHPHEAASWNAEVAAAVGDAVDHPAVVAVGEAGLDYHYDHAPRDVQRRVFAAQLALAAERRLPIVVHAREADDDMTAMLRDADATVVLHSFSAGPEVLQVGLDRGCYLSFSGMVTFRSWDGEEALRAVPDGRLLVETDAPYLAPVPHRGKRNEPALVRHVAERVARVRGATLEQVSETTTRNAGACFGARVNPLARDDHG